MSGPVTHDFDYLTPRTHEEITAEFARLRRECPVSHSSAHRGFWVVARHDDIDEVAHRPDIFSFRDGWRSTTRWDSTSPSPR